eukprot:TRINITY_DN6037_c0_g1_i1.p1 TRINITY_DN6037_c0_g1~~TRINITY_DN6037_c0_g1_i1.p1  ORF type:complete len:191 (+),score=10.28 TRINITY_DN6037_c0_g1_i1:150-722(+)
MPQLQITVLRGRNFGRCDQRYYAKVRWRGLKHKTNVSSATRDPEWNQSFRLDVGTGECMDPVTVEVWMQNYLSANECVAGCCVYFHHLHHGRTCTAWHPTTDAGEVELGVLAMDFTPARLALESQPMHPVPLTPPPMAVPARTYLTAALVPVYWSPGQMYHAPPPGSVMVYQQTYSDATRRRHDDGCVIA